MVRQVYLPGFILRTTLKIYIPKTCNTTDLPGLSRTHKKMVIYRTVLKQNVYTQYAYGLSVKSALFYHWMAERYSLLFTSRLLKLTELILGAKGQALKDSYLYYQ